ncbi:putative aldo-keto reductase 1 [Camellia lanceoleosa]|uniref:Aldo-keto reductase 1 n=1 Tax=Camellia lanceoleosa TaxID=1840588 RepID=A0ACC0IGD0_9ERIC|nr:putative aldo-keto reductase 1 [Camellia lanceoleosa]
MYPFELGGKEGVFLISASTRRNSIFIGVAAADASPPHSPLRLYVLVFQSEVCKSRDINEKREPGIAIVPYFPTAHRFFGGKAVVKAVPTNSFLLSHPWFTGQNLEHNKIFYLQVKELAKKHSCTPVQLALAWILRQRDDMVPIPGTTKIKNLDENIGAVRVKLT